MPAIGKPHDSDLVTLRLLKFPPMLPAVQILNLENFQITMYSVIRATNYASSMFWLAWIIMGKFILLTLFLAVTLDAFERKYEVSWLYGRCKGVWAVKRGGTSHVAASIWFTAACSN